MTEEPPHPSRTLLRVLGGRVRVTVGAAALACLLEKVALVAVTFEVVGDRPGLAALLGALLAALLFARSAARSFLRVEVQSRLLGAVTAALLDEGAEIVSPNADETELALFHGVSASEALIGENLPELLGDIPACACMLAIACVALPARLVVEGGASMLLGAGAILVARRVTARTAERVWEAYEPLLEDLSTAVRGRVEVVASGTGERFLSALGEKIQRWRAVSTRASLLSFFAGRAPALAAAFAAGLFLVLDESVRGIFAHGILGRAALLASMTPAFAGVARAWMEVGKSMARVRPIAALVERGAHPPSRGDAPPPLPALVALDHVAFSYGAPQDAVLKDLSFAWRPGEVLALTGANGSGKSTLLSLLLGLAKPTRGAISVGGKDLHSLDAPLWRRSIAYLSQRPFLSDRATVGGAMCLLAPDADGETVERSLRQVKLWPVLVHRSPQSPLDAKVGSLSAGEKQRLALARVLARRAPLILLDEPDANLDAEGLELLIVLLRELAPGRMIAVAAHSPRLIASADRVLALDEGSGGDVKVNENRMTAGVLRTA
jgi:ABC-type multidrug transport system fused ATPase/permease subunit